MKMIIAHPNYKGLPIKINENGSINWLVTAQSEIGQKRIAWCLKKADELGLPRAAGVYSKVMLAIHPTKKKVCQICGKEMSLYYHYPTANFTKMLNKDFHLEFSTCDHISDIWDILIKSGVTEEFLIKYFIKKGKLSLDPTKLRKKK